MADNRPSVYREGADVIYRASALGSCVRALLAFYDGVSPRRKKEMTELMELAADEGDVHEDAVRAKLVKEGYKVLATQEEFSLQIIPHAFVRGHTDGRISPPKHPVGIKTAEALLEVKSKSNKQYELWKSKRWEAFPGHAYQITAYMEAFPGRDCLYIVKRRETGEDDRVIIPAGQPPIPFKEVKKKVIAVEIARVSGTTPLCDLAPQQQWMCPVWFLHDEKDIQTAELTPEMIAVMVDLIGKRQVQKAIEDRGKVAEKDRKMLDAELQNLLGEENDKAEVGDYTLTRVNSSSPSWDEEGMVAQFGDAVKAFKRSKPYSYLAVREKKEKKK